MPIAVEAENPLDDTNGDTESQGPTVKCFPKVCGDCIGERESCELAKKLNFSNEDMSICFEEKEIANTGVSCIGGLRESLAKMQEDDKTKRNLGQRSNILGPLGGTPSFMLSPPKEVLVEKYFHPDHMSSAEKQKIELKSVRDKFKISESDCGLHMLLRFHCTAQNIRRVNMVSLE